MRTTPVTKASAYCSGNRTGRRGAMDLRRTRRHMVHTVRVLQDAFAYVLFGVVIVGVIAAIASFFFRADAYDSIGRGGFFVDEDAARRGPGGAASVNVAERDEEIRQMLEARNARRVAAGKEPVDVEDELARLVAPTVDAQLREEIRDHVVARNARRIRRGQEPMDVDAEVERQISSLGQL